MIIGAGLIVAITTTSFAGTISGNITATGKRTNADAVVYIEEVPGETFTPPSEHAKMDQIRMVFTPYVLPVLVGTTVDFHNSDPLAHNVFTVDDCADGFDLGNWNQGEFRSHTFDKPCAAVILCSVHPEMEAYVVAVPTTYFAVSDDKGFFEIKDLPDGTYTLRIWHPQLKEAGLSVAVSGSATVDVVLKE